MKKHLVMLAALLMMGTAGANAQGFLGKLKQKAQQAVIDKKATAEISEAVQDESDEPADPSKLAVAAGDDIVPKRKTPTVTWDGTFTPSSASSASALMAELPQLPSAEKMARSTMEERDAYALKIARVVARAEQLQKGANGCSDADMEALRQKWERKVQDMFGLTKEEMAILNDENAPDSKKEPIQQKVMAKIMGGNFSKQMQQTTGALTGYEAKVGQLAQNFAKVITREANHDYNAIGKKYESKLQKLYEQICGIDDAAKIDALYDEADQLLYNYRLEAAKEYRASLLRLISEHKKFAAEYTRLSREVVASGDLPECAIGRADLNSVIAVGNILDQAYKDLPELQASPVCQETVYELPKGWTFGAWECRGYIGGVNDFKSPGGNWPLLAQSAEAGEYAVVENGKFRKINEDELKAINKKADARLKKGANSGTNPPYGVYKSRSGKRVVEYSKTGEIILNGMTTYAPAAFTANPDRLEWIIFDEGKIVKCTYKL